MKIADIIRAKGSEVVTITADARVTELVDLLSTRRIGAVVVSTDGHQVTGIVSERDVVHHLATDGAEVLNMKVRDIMVSPAVTCSDQDGIGATARTMTYSRLRHLPVVTDGELHAIVSLGDVVKYRIEQLTDERNHLIGYLHS